MPRGAAADLKRFAGGPSLLLFACSEDCFAKALLPDRPITERGVIGIDVRDREPSDDLDDAAALRSCGEPSLDAVPPVCNRLRNSELFMVGRDRQVQVVV